MEPYQEYAHRPPLETTGKIEQLTPDMAHAKLLARLEKLEDDFRKMSDRSLGHQKDRADFNNRISNLEKIAANKPEIGSDDDMALTRLRERLEKLEERLRKMRGDKLDQLPDNEKLTPLRLRLERLEENLRKSDKSIKHLHGALGRNNKQIARLENPGGYEDPAEPEIPENRCDEESTKEGARGVGEPMEAQDAIAHTIAGMDYKLAEILSHLQKFDMERTDERARGGWREEAERQGISEKWMKFFQELQEKHLAEKKDDGARGYKMSEPPADTEWQAQPQLVVELRFDLYTAFDQEANAYLSYCPETGQMDQGDSVSEARVAMGEGAKLLLESTIERILTDKK